MTRRITPQTSLDNLKKEAKRWLKEIRANNAEALERFARTHPKPPVKTALRDVQHALAMEYGFSCWKDLKQALANDAAEKYSRLATDMVTAYASSDAEAMRRINEHYGRSSTVEDLRSNVWRNIYKVRQAKGSPSAFGIPEAQELIFRMAGFPNWEALIRAGGKASPAAVPACSIDPAQQRIDLRREPNERDWDSIIGAMKEHRIATLEANGFMTDDALRRIAELDHVTSLSLGGSRQLSDDGLLHIRRMPQLQQLYLHEYPGGKLTDHGLEVLRHLPNLRIFEMTWQRGISDAGVANLKLCEKIEHVNLMGSPTGDGVIEALRGKPNLHRLDTGKLVTDRGLSMLDEFPKFKTCSGGDETNDRKRPHLLVDGPFTNQGFVHIAQLEGLYALTFFWHVTGITPAAFEALTRLPHLTVLGCDGELSDDHAMAHFAAIPRLRRLNAQGTVATDDGFIALSRSRSLERFWGRECPNLTGRGFVALSMMPTLQALAVSCKRVDDAALSSLPRFPALRDLTPIDVQDDGFRHVGRCRQLERLACMYCRDTTDVATEHVAGLKIKTYYAGLTKITDRSLEILGRMSSLESIEFYETRNITDAGLPHIANLPRLREVHLSGLPQVTPAGVSVFPSHVRVHYDV